MDEDTSLITEAVAWLDQLEKDLMEEGLYVKDYYGLVDRMEFEIRRYDSEHVEAIKMALETWSNGGDDGQRLLAGDLLERLGNAS